MAWANYYSRRIRSLIVLLTVLAITSNAAALLVFWRVYQTTDAKRTEIEQQSRLSYDIARDLEQPQTEVARTIELILDTSRPYDNKDQPVQKLMALLNRYPNDRVDYKIGEKIDQLRQSLNVFQDLLEYAQDWRKEYLVLEPEINQQYSLKKIRETIESTRQLVDDAWGRARLVIAYNLREYRAAKGENALKLGSKLLSSLEKDPATLLRTIRTEILDLAVQVEILNAEINPDNLADLRDNRFRPLLNRFESAVNSLSGIDPESTKQLRLVPSSLRSSLFGEGYLDDQGQQEIKLGHGGLFAVRARVLELTSTRSQILKEADAAFAEMVEATRDFVQVHEVQSQMLSQLIRNEIHATWNTIVKYGALIFAAFITLAIAMNFIISKQVKLIQENQRLAEASSKAKSEFMANMSHELRTPLNGIIGMAGLVLESKLDQDQAENLKLVIYSARSLLALITDILDFSKIEAGKLNISEDEFSLLECVKGVLAVITPLAQEKNICLIQTISSDIPDRLKGDPLRLAQVLVNLLGNSIKFSETDSYVLLFVEQLESSSEGKVQVHFSVADCGIGIAKDKQNLIFDAFSQADGSTTRKYGGTGLGLTISKQLVELMGGKIWVKSIQSIGSNFHFTCQFQVVTLDRLTPAVSRTRVDTPLIVVDACTLEKDNSSAAAIKILVAEDNIVNQKLLVGILKRRGFEVVLANNGHEAIEALEQDKFSLVLMDIQMPQMSGVEATQLIRAGGKHYANIPIIALTAHVMDGDKERFLAAGMNYYVSKPIDINALLEKVKLSLAT